MAGVPVRLPCVLFATVVSVVALVVSLCLRSAIRGPRPFPRLRTAASRSSGFRRRSGGDRARSPCRGRGYAPYRIHGTTFHSRRLSSAPSPVASVPAIYDAAHAGEAGESDTEGADSRYSGSSLLVDVAL